MSLEKNKEIIIPNETDKSFTSSRISSVKSIVAALVLGTMSSSCAYFQKNNEVEELALEPLIDYRSKFERRFFKYRDTVMEFGHLEQNLDEFIYVYPNLKNFLDQEFRKYVNLEDSNEKVSKLITQIMSLASEYGEVTENYDLEYFVKVREDLRALRKGDEYKDTSEECHYFVRDMKKLDNEVIYPVLDKVYALINTIREVRQEVYLTKN